MIKDILINSAVLQHINRLPSIIDDALFFSKKNSCSFYKALKNKLSGTNEWEKDTCQNLKYVLSEFFAKPYKYEIRCTNDEIDKLYMSNGQDWSSCQYLGNNHDDYCANPDNYTRYEDIFEDGGCYAKNATCIAGDNMIYMLYAGDRLNKKSRALCYVHPFHPIAQLERIYPFNQKYSNNPFFNALCEEADKVGYHMPLEQAYIEKVIRLLKKEYPDKSFKVERRKNFFVEINANASIYLDSKYGNCLLIYADDLDLDKVGTYVYGVEPTCTHVHNGVKCNNKTNGDFLLCDYHLSPLEHNKYYAVDTEEYYTSDDDLYYAVDTGEYYASTDTLYYAVDTGDYYASDDDLYYTVDERNYYASDDDLYYTVDTEEHYASNDDLYYAVDTEEYYDSDDDLYYAVDTGEYYASTDTLYYAVDTEDYYASDDDLYYAVDTGEHYASTDTLYYAVDTEEYYDSDDDLYYAVDTEDYYANEENLYFNEATKEYETTCENIA